MKCDIIIPVWDQLELTKNCVEHIIRNTKYPYRLIIIDNGSKDAARQYLEEFKKSRPAEVALIRNEKNLGFIKAANQGMRISDAPYVCILNNDTIPAPGWLEELIEFAETHKEMGLLNPQSNRDMRIPFEEHARNLAKNSGKYMEMNQCFGYCMLIKREVIDRIGYLDEAFGMGSYDDTDYSMRAYKAGYLCANVHSSYVHHVYNASFKALGGQNRIVSRCEVIYFTKWPRHLRVGMGFSLSKKTDDSEIEHLLKAALFMAREWCWINLWIFGDETLNRKRLAKISEEIGMPLHQNIKFSYFPDSLKSAHIIVKVLERSFGTKRRKRYDALIIDGLPGSALLKALHPFHGARIKFMDPKGNIVPGLKHLIDDIRYADKVK